MDTATGELLATANDEISEDQLALFRKAGIDAVERYVFFNNGTQVTLTLSGAKGADNVDPWKIVSDSVKWL